jgi:hypothetical protein
LEARGSGSGPIVFGMEQLDGPLDMGPLMTSDCAEHRLVRGVAAGRPFVKSGGFDQGNPNAAFWKAYFADPVLRLPAGRWRIAASIELAIGDCAEPWHRLEAAAEFEVRP